MVVREFLDEAEQLLTAVASAPTPDRVLMLSWINNELSDVLSQEDWDWATVRLSPIVAVSGNRRVFNLPDDFNGNFVKYSGLNGDYWACKLISSAQEFFLTYEAPAQFIGRNLSATSTGRPSHYTVLSRPDGILQVTVDPLPDAAYSLTGLYVPTRKIKDPDEIAPTPGNNMVLLYGLMTRVFSNLMLDKNLERVASQQLAYYSRERQRAFAALLMQQSRSRMVQAIPVKNATGSSYNSYAAFKVY